MKYIIAIFLISMILIGGCASKEPELKEPETEPESITKTESGPPAFPEGEEGSGSAILPTRNSVLQRVD